MKEMNSTAKFPAGPKGLPILGVFPEVSKDVLGFLEKISQDYGDIVGVRVLGLRSCYVFRPDLVHKVLTLDGENFVKSRHYVFMRGLLGNGLITSDGDFWRRNRRKIQPMFVRHHLDTYTTLMVKYALERRDAWKDGQVFNIHEEMMHTTLRIVAKTMFGADVERHADEVCSVMDVGMKWFAIVSNHLVPKWLPTPSTLKIRRVVRKLDGIIDNIVAERRALGTESDDLLSSLMRDQKSPEGISDFQVREEVKTLFVSGHETTANTLAFTWYLLAKHPEVEAKLIAELDEVLGGRPPSLADLPNLPYVEKVFKEALRFYPPSFLLGRTALNDYKIDDYTIPAGTTVWVTQWIAHRDGRYYDEPEKFNPDRWTEKFEKELPDGAYFPFGGGARKCIGIHFAMDEGRLLLAVFAQMYRFSPVSDEEISLLPSITLRPTNGLMVKVHKRPQYEDHFLSSTVLPKVKVSQVAASCPYVHAAQ